MQVRAGFPFYSLNEWFVKNDQVELLFLGDLTPTSYHFEPHCVMGYDLYPAKIIKERKKWVSELAWKKVFGYFFHDPAITFFQLEKMIGCKGSGR